MPRQFDNLQCLRGVACLLVVVYHVAQAEIGLGLGFNPLKPFRWFGYAGVDVFFVLSGFIIASSNRADLGRATQLPRYLFRRLWRIYPTYWFALLVCVAAALWNPTVALALWNRLPDSALLLPQSIEAAVLPVAWTLTFEVMFYLAFAALFLLPRRVALPVLLGWAVAVVGCSAAGVRPTGRYSSLPLNPLVLEFLAGCVLAWVPARLTGRAAAVVGVAALGWAAVASAVYFDANANRLPMNYLGRVIVYGLPAALAVLALTGWERAGGRIRSRWLLRAGDASYSIYLVHAPMMVLVTLLTMWVGLKHSRLGHTAWIGMMLVVGVVPGLLVYRFVEAPLLRLVKKPRPKLAVVEAEAIPVRRAA